MTEYRSCPSCRKRMRAMVADSVVFAFLCVRCRMSWSKKMLDEVA